MSVSQIQRLTKISDILRSQRNYKIDIESWIDPSVSINNRGITGIKQQIRNFLLENGVNSAQINLKTNRYASLKNKIVFSLSN